VVRIGGGIIVLKVTGNALPGGIGIVSVDMALGAADIGMTFGEREG